MSTRGYGSYRGRNTLKTAFKILTLLLVVLLILGGVTFVILRQHLVVSGDGVRLELPFFKDEIAVSTPDAGYTDLIVDPSPEVLAPPEAEPEPCAPVLLPREALYDGSAQNKVETYGGDCALFDMKDDSGALAYASSIPLAKDTRQTTADALANVAIRSMNNTEGLYTVARVSCCKDHNITDYQRSLAIFTNSGYRWADLDDIRWISPTNSDVRDYLTAICVELAELGFDEILLDNAGYPGEGNLHYIKKGEAYDETQFASVIDGFYAQVADALAEYDVKLSVVTTAQALDGTEMLTGQTPENLAQFDRIWMQNEDGTLLPLEGE